MSSKLFRGSDILNKAKQSKTVKVTRTQTAKQAKSAITRKYKDVVASAQYYHRGSGVWIKYSSARDKKRTSKGAKKSIPKNYSTRKHQIDVRGVDTKLKRTGKAIILRKKIRSIPSKNKKMLFTHSIKKQTIKGVDYRWIEYSITKNGIDISRKWVTAKLTDKEEDTIDNILEMLRKEPLVAMPKGTKNIAWTIENEALLIGKKRR